MNTRYESGVAATDTVLFPPFLFPFIHFHIYYRRQGGPATAGVLSVRHQNKLKGCELEDIFAKC